MAKPPNPEVLIRQAQIALARQSFIAYVRMVAPWFIIEEIHVIMGFYLEQVAFGKVDRLRMHTGPRGGKSMFVSVLFVSWYIGLNPNDKIFEAANTADLAVTFGEQVLDLLSSDIYKVIFPEVRVRKRSAKRMRFTGNSQKQNGEYQAFGMGGRIAGRGFNLGILDDPLTEQEYLSTTIKQKHWDWFQVGFYTRRQPEKNAIIIMATRWAHDDIPGRLERQEKENKADKYTVVSIPAVLDEASASLLSLAARLDPLPPEGYYIPYSKGMSYAPRRFPAALLRATRRNMSDDHWNALYKQRPTADDGKIIKRSFWKVYRPEMRKTARGLLVPVLPDLLYKIIVADTAYEEHELADYSAIQVWGVMYRPAKVSDGRGGKVEHRHRVPILLDSWRKQVEFPELKTKLREFVKHYNPDEVFVEKRASGASLIQELRGFVPGLKPWLPQGKVGTKDKVSRAWRAALVMAETMTLWDSSIDENGNVIDECAMFPVSDTKDHVDCVTMAIDILRRKFLIDVKGDHLEDWEEERRATAPPAEERRPF